MDHYVELDHEVSDRFTLNTFVATGTRAVLGGYDHEEGKDIAIITEIDPALFLKKDANDRPVSMSNREKLGAITATFLPTLTEEAIIAGKREVAAHKFTDRLVALADNGDLGGHFEEASAAPKKAALAPGMVSVLLGPGR